MLNTNKVNPLKGLNYGVIGNGSTAALISHRGSIDYCCFPFFNSPGIFAQLLDKEKGGNFAIRCSDDYAISQKYIKNTNIIMTSFRSEEGDFDVLDFMPRHRGAHGEYHNPSEIIRYIRVKKGTPKFRVEYNPALGFAQHPTKNTAHRGFIKSVTSQGNYESMYLYSSFDFQDILEGQEITLTQNGFFLLSYNQKLLPVDQESIYLEYSRTKVYWLEWTKRTVSFQAYGDEIIRSALVLKLLSFQKTGSIIAAVTNGLPETAGEERNWDYRFCWIRDASMTIQILFSLRHINGAKRFLKFIIDAIPYKDEKVQIMYGIRGEKELTEKSLDWLAGYKDSRPVRVGNAAYFQKQNDIYGVLLDVIYQNFQYFGNEVENAEELWTITRSLVRNVERHWHEADMGIWEFRSQKKHFVFSKVLCWVALDRGTKIAQVLGMEEYASEWQNMADEIKKDIHEKGWKEDRGAFTQAYEGDALDAANLLMANYGFIDPMDPRYVSTVKQTQKELCKNGLMFRYINQDDFGLPKSSFTVCTFWMIKALYLIGERKEARHCFDALLKEANHLGLYSEDMDFETKELLGNFPQGYSHLALIDTAITLGQGEVTDEEAVIDRLENTQNIQDLWGEEE